MSCDAASVISDTTSPHAFGTHEAADVATADGNATVTLSGDFDLATVGVLVDAMKQAVALFPQLITIDMTGVAFFGVAALDPILDCTLPLHVLNIPASLSRMQQVLGIHLSPADQQPAPAVAGRRT